MTMPTLNSADRERWFSLQSACYHEYAHALVAEHYGALTSVHIEFNPGNAAKKGAAAFHGACDMLSPTTRRQKRIIGVAGLLAEALLRHEMELDDRDAARLFVATFEEYHKDRLSATDAKFMGLPPRLRIVRTCLAILRAAWPEIENRAGTRIGYEWRVYVGDGAAAEA